jgi:hypothetical protein
MIRKAAADGAQIVCLQEIFYGPYFCAEQTTRWYDSTEKVPGRAYCAADAWRWRRSLASPSVVPIYEVEEEGVFYNTAAVIGRDGEYLGKYRKTHIPHVAPGFWEKFYFRPGNLGYPVFDLGFVQDRRLYLLRPSFSRRRAGAGAEWRGDCLQSVGDGGGAERVSVEAGAAGACGGQRLFRRRDQPRGRRRRRGTSASSTARATSATRAARSLRRLRATRTRCDGGPGPGYDRRGTQDVAVLSRPPARYVWRSGEAVEALREESYMTVSTKSRTEIALCSLTCIRRWMHEQPSLRRTAA